MSQSSSSGISAPGLEHWYKLYREETPDGQVKYFTSTEHIIEGQGLGAWDKFNTHYPHPNPIQKFAQEEQFLSEGLKQVASTSGSQPLTPEGPTGTLAAIAQAITQPTADPTPVTQTAPIPQFTNTPAPTPTMATVITATGQIIDIGESGALFGAPPSHFYGDRTKAANFLLAFKG